MAIRSADPCRRAASFADLKLYYSAEDLPDDPNFNEAALKVIAFDPATGKLESYPTTVDLAARSATRASTG